MFIYNLFPPLAVVFTVISALMICWIVGLHARKNNLVRREVQFRKKAAPLVKSYLAGQTPLEEVVALLKTNPPVALQKMIERAEKPTPAEWQPLKLLIKALPFGRQMVAGLGSRSRYTRIQSAQYLGYLRDESAIPALIKTLDDRVPAVRLAAAQSLARLGFCDAVKPILHALDLPEDLPHDRVVEVLVQFGACAVEPLLEIMNQPGIPDGALAMAIKASGMLKSTRAVPRMIETLHHNQLEVRINSLHALAAIGDPAAIPPLSRLAEDPVWEVRQAVMASLGALGAADRILLLVKGMADPVWEVRLAAARALHHLGEPGTKALAQAADSHPDPSVRNISRQILHEHDGLPPGTKELP